MVWRNNRNLDYKDRPPVGVGNNHHMKNIQYIREAIGYHGGEANTHQIYDWVNQNTRNGIGSRQLPQVLKKGPFISTGLVRVKNALGSGSYTVNLWRVRDNSY